ncbi:MAG TPA: phosphatase PAP2 family protein [Allosphingosinicella sp.]|nr:phosphatase PAP2 family protein [Allosphingosinicella sp.]
MTKKTDKDGPAQRLMDADAAALAGAKPYRDTAAVRALSWYSELGDQPQMLTLSGGVLALGLARRDARLARAGLRMIAAHLLATAAKNFVKRRVDRTRPRSARGEDGHKPRPGRNDSKEETSFPSGHSAGAVAVARAFAREYPAYRLPAHGAAGLIALAQIPRCAHYPTDVGAGIAIGLAAEALVDGVWSGLSRSGEAAGQDLEGSQPSPRIENL